MGNISQLIEAVNQAKSSDELLERVETLAAARDQAALNTLIEILGYNNPGAAVAAVEGLIELGEVAVPSLLEKIDGYNYGARAWAVRALAGIGDHRALDTLTLAATSDFSQSVRRAAARGLGIINWSQVAPAQVEKQQTQVLQTLITVSQDEEWVVRYAAVTGLETLGEQLDDNSQLKQKILTRIKQISQTDAEMVVVARAKLALDSLL